MSSEFPPLQQRDLILTSGVRVTLLHDPQASRLALGAGIAAGSLHEPPAWPGLAHFLEHALFLGSHGWPDSGAFAAYVQGLGGRYNASTLGLHTRYYLELPADELRPALARFCDLLARPLLDPVRLAAEREVLHAEYLARCRDAGSRAFAALSGLLETGHPLAGFHAGHRDSLDTGDPALHAALRAWHARHYAGTGLRLLLCGPQPLDVLESAVRAQAARLPGGGQAAAPCTGSPWPSGQPAQWQTLGEDSRRLRLWWLAQRPLSDPAALLAALRGALRRRDPGSLAGQLAARGLGAAPALGWHPQAPGLGLLSLSLDDVPAAPAARLQAAACCRDWLVALAAAPLHGLPAPAPHLLAWDEYEQAPLERLAHWLARWLEQGSAALRLWPAAPDAGRLAADLSALAGPPQVLQQSGRVAPQAACTDWFAVRWQARPLPALPPPVAGWSAPPHTRLPEPPAPGHWPDCWPAVPAGPLRPGQAGLLLEWQAASDAETSATADTASDAALQAALLEQALALRWAQLDGLAERHAAQLQLEEAGSGRLRLSLSAEREALPGLLLALLEGLDGAPAEWRAGWQRARATAARQILLRRLLAEPATGTRMPGVPAAVLAARLARCSDAALADQLPQHWRRGRLCVWRLGDSAVSAVALQRRLGQPCAPAAWPPPPASGTPLQRLGLPGSERAVLLRLWTTPGDPRQEAAWRLLALLQQSDFHRRLRVEQGLGYALFSRFLFAAEGGELQYGVQSPHAGSATLQAALQDFLHQHAGSLETLDAARLQAARQAALQALAGADRPARQRHATALAFGNWPSDWPARVRAALLELDHATLLDAARRLCQPAQARRWLFSD